MEFKQDKSSRPGKATQAVMLLYVTLGIGLLRSAMEASRLSQLAGLAFGISISLAVVFIMWFLIYMIGKGKNWARITFLILWVIGLPFSVLPLLQSLAANLASGLLGVAQIAIQVLALTFLFQKASSDWFRETTESRPSA